MLGPHGPAERFGGARSPVVPRAAVGAPARRGVTAQGDGDEAETFGFEEVALDYVLGTESC